MREILLGDGSKSLPHNSTPKPLPVLNKLSSPLPRATPEHAGIESKYLEDFYREVSYTKKTGVHSLIILRDGKVISEGYFNPYRKNIWHVTHSLAKSVTGTAVGLAIDEGLFGLDDKVIDYFEDKTNLFLPKRSRAITVRHLLTMSSGIAFNEISEAVENNWVKGIFTSGTIFEPGEKFVYNSMNSYLLAALITVTSGQTVMDYLHTRLFSPMGFGSIAWETCPAGIEKGGWGMYILPEDMAKLGLLYLQNGRYCINGKTHQLLSEKWVREATKTQISGSNKETYGFQIWTGPDGSFIMSGMFGQYILALPKQNILIVANSGTPHLFIDSPLFTLIEKYFIGKQFPSTIPENILSHGSLQRTLQSLHFNQPLVPHNRIPQRIKTHTQKDKWNLLHAPSHKKPAPEWFDFCGTTWRFSRNRGGFLPVIVQAMNNNFSTGVKALRLEPCNNGTILFYWEEGTSTICIPFGINKAVESQVNIGRETFLIAATGKITPDEDGTNVLVLELCLLEHSSSRIIKLRRKGTDLTVDMDELPEFSLAIESIINQSENTSHTSTNDNKAKMVLNNEFTRFRISQLCNPHLLGVRYSEKSEV